MTFEGRSPKVAFVNLGCRVNRVETDMIAQSLEAAGCELVQEDEADLIVVNTCAVTAEAESKARKAVRHAAHRPQHPKVIATGCVASLFTHVLEQLGTDVIVEPIKAYVAKRALAALGLNDDGMITQDTTGLVVSPTPTGRMRPGIKVQDGCDNRCTYCIVWKARGASRSRAVDEVLKDIRAACARGAHEVVLTGINLGRYNVTTESGQNLDIAGLLDTILDKTNVERVRLSSIEPPEVTKSLLSCMAASDGRVAPYLHICLQSGSNDTLKRMGRVYTREFYADVIEAARTTLPGVALGTDVIVGFPGETNTEFDDSLRFCEQMHFAKMHVFRYSKRPGTPAASMPNQVDAQISAQRSEHMRAMAAKTRFEEAQCHVGEIDKVLVQYPHKGVSSGLFPVALSADCELGSFIPVHYDAIRPDGTLVGTPCSAEC